MQTCILWLLALMAVLPGPVSAAEEQKTADTPPATDPLSPAEPLAIPTFNCLGLYWKPAAGAADNPCQVTYRVAGTAAWHEAQPLWYDATDHPGMTAHSREYRGSIVGLTPDTAYEVRLQLARTGTAATVAVRTWSEAFPVLRTVEIPAGALQPYVINEGGSATTGYVLYTQAAGQVLDGGNSAVANVIVNAPFVIVRGVTARNAQRNGIQLGDVQDVLIDDCDISGWGRIASDCPFGVNLDAAVYSSSSRLTRIVVQHCRLHHPRSNSNSWTESRPHDGGVTKHPIGPQGITLANGLGRYVIRHNRIWSDDQHKFNDGMGEVRNFSYAGFPNRDSDIHDNDISHAYDDGAEVEGADMNVRVWSNRFSEVYGAVGAATSSLGPLYIWRNVLGSSRKGPADDADGNKGAYLVKLGNENRQWCLGSIFVFHNTMLQPPARPGFTGTSGGQAGLLWTSPTKLQNHVTARNNILFVRSSSQPSAHDSSKDATNQFDYDLFNGGISGAPGLEAHGIHGTPLYDTTTAGLYPLQAGSPGIDAGVRLANFNDGFTGAAPDIGAFESSGPAPATPTTAPLATPADSPTPQLTGTAPAGSLITIYDHAVAIGTTTATSTGTWSWTVTPALTPGEHQLTYTITVTIASAAATSGHSPAVTITIPPPTSTPATTTASTSNRNGCGLGAMLVLMLGPVGLLLALRQRAGR